MAQSSEQLTQGNLFYAVIDEVDSILVDEARTPLIISGRVEESTKWYLQFSKFVKQMKKDFHYEVDESKKQIHPTEDGIEFIEQKLGIEKKMHYVSIFYYVRFAFYSYFPSFFGTTLTLKCNIVLI